MGISSVVLLGGDGFCGWPTALHLSGLGMRTTIVDNLSRRRIAQELGAPSLTPIQPLAERVAAWRETQGTWIETAEIDLARDYTALRDLLARLRPEAIVHFAEQRSAPYSMRSPVHRRYTVSNNVNATHNVLAAMAELALDAHLVHLGSAGVYGYAEAGLRLPEGYLDITARGADGREMELKILYPGKPDSIYHMTKAQDQLLFAFYARNEGLRITDLHQGIVWGTQTVDTLLDPRLSNRFDYDRDYGTVVNRFIVQAVTGRPLTVHGVGEQTRAFIHIRDMVRCIELALASPPARGDRVRILNQVAETRKIVGLAQKIVGVLGGEIAFVDNPRREPASNNLDLDNTTLIDLGFRPTRLEEGLVEEIAEIAAIHAHRIDPAQLAPQARLIDPSEKAALAL